jgi:hypothetical protein
MDVNSSAVGSLEHGMAEILTVVAFSYPWLARAMGRLGTAGCRGMGPPGQRIQDDTFVAASSSCNIFKCAVAKKRKAATVLVSNGEPLLSTEKRTNRIPKSCDTVLITNRSRDVLFQMRSRVA